MNITLTNRSLRADTALFTISAATFALEPGRAQPALAGQTRTHGEQHVEVPDIKTGCAVVANTSHRGGKEAASPVRI